MEGGNYEVTITLKIRTYSESIQDAINLTETQIYSAFNDVDNISSYKADYHVEEVINK